MDSATWGVISKGFDFNDRYDITALEVRQMASQLILYEHAHFLLEPPRHRR
jgi:hypothetical protein